MLGSYRGALLYKELLTELTNLELEFSQGGRKDCFSGHEYDVNEPLGACVLDWTSTGLMVVLLR